MGSRTLVPPGGRRVGKKVRQRDDPHHARGRSVDQAPGPARRPGERQARPVRTRCENALPSPGSGVGRPCGGEPGRGLPHPLRHGARTLVRGRLLADPSHQDHPTRSRPRRRRDRRGHQRRSPRRLAPRHPRQPDGPTAPVLLRPVPRRPAPRRPGTARPHAAAELGQDLRRQGHRGGRPRLPGRENQREARAQPPIPATHLRHADRQAPSPADLHGRHHRYRGHRRRPGLHEQVGRPTLAEADGRPHPEDHPARCGEHRDRTTRPRTPDPATDDTAPCTPERCARASDRPGRPASPRA